MTSPAVALFHVIHGTGLLDKVSGSLSNYRACREYNSGSVVTHEVGKTSVEGTGFDRAVTGIRGVDGRWAEGAGRPGAVDIQAEEAGTWVGCKQCWCSRRWASPRIASS